MRFNSCWAKSLLLLCQFALISCVGEYSDRSDVTSSPSNSDKTESRLQILATNKAGLPYVGQQLHFRSISGYPLVADVGPSTDENGEIYHDLKIDNYYVMPGITSSPTRSFAYAKNSNYIPTVSITNLEESYTAVFPEAVFLDMNATHSSGTIPTLTNEKYFAQAVSLSQSIDFCQAGIGVSYGSAYLPPGAQIFIYADSSGQPANVPILSSSEISAIAIYVPSSTRGDATGGLTGNFCDANHSTRTLASGNYWIVVSFPSVPTTVGIYNLHIWGTTDLGQAGILPMVSSDGNSWTSRTYTAGGETRKSVVTFLLE